jgi:hypothetical protein
MDIVSPGRFSTEGNNFTGAQGNNRLDVKNRTFPHFVKLLDLYFSAGTCSLAALSLMNVHMSFNTYVIPTCQLVEVFHYKITLNSVEEVIKIRRWCRSSASPVLSTE